MKTAMRFIAICMKGKLATLAVIITTIMDEMSL